MSEKEMMHAIGFLRDCQLMILTALLIRRKKFLKLSEEIC